MAYDSNITPPLRITDYFQFNCDLTFSIQREDSMVLVMRLDNKIDRLTSNWTWRKLQTWLEEGAISRISVRENMSKLHNLAKELSEKTTESVDKLGVLLVRLSLQESLGSTSLKVILNYILRCDVSSVILQRIHKIIEELKLSIPPYKLENLKRQHTFKRDDMFGRDIHFVSRDKNKIVKSDVSHLYDIELPEVENKENEELEVIDDNDAAPSLPIDDQEPFEELQCDRFADADVEEVRYQLIPNCVNKSDSLVPVSQLSEMGQSVFGYELTLTDLESIVYKSVFDSNGNILINLPLGYDKTTLIALAILSVVEQNCDSKVLYLVPSIELAECMALRLKRCIISTNIKVAAFNNSAELNYKNVDPVHVVVTTADIWEIQNMDRDLCPLMMLIVDEMNCLGEKSGPFLEVIIGRMLEQVTLLHKRIIGFTMSLLSVHCGPSFSTLADYLKVKKENVLILSEHYMHFPPLISVIRKIESDCQILIGTIYEKLLNNNKVVVFVKNKKHVIDVAKAIQDRMERYQIKYLALPDSVMKTLTNLMEDEGTDNVSMSLCSQGYLTLHSGLTRYTRDYLCDTFKMGLARIIISTANYAEMLSGDVDAVIVKDTDFLNEEMNPLINKISSVGRMLALATTSNICKRHVIFIVNDMEKFLKYQDLLQNKIYVKSQLLDILPDLLNNEIIVSSVKNKNDCEKWFERSFQFHYMKTLNALCTLDDEVKRIIIEALETLEMCGMINFTGKFDIRATDFNYALQSHQVSYTTLEFLWNYAATYLDKSDMEKTLCNAPVFSSLMEKMDEAQENEISTLARKFRIEKCENWKINALLKAFLSGKESPKLKCLQTYIIQELFRLIRIMFEMYLTTMNYGVITTVCMQLACAMEKRLREPKKPPKLLFEAHLQMISKSVMNVNFHIYPSPSWKKEVGDSGHLFWLWILDVNLILNYTCVELTRKCVEEDGYLIISLPVYVTRRVHPQCKAYLLSCESWEWWYSCDVPFQKIKLPTDNPTYTELLLRRPLSKTTLKNKILEEMFNFQLFSPVIAQVFDALYHKDKNVLVTSLEEDLITAAQIAIFRALSQKPGAKVVYVTKWMPEVEKRFISWKSKFEKLGQKVISFSGQVDKDIQEFALNDIILTTSHHWEIASRSSVIRKSLASEEVSLMVVNGLHLLDGEMESALMRILASPQRDNIRILGLSYPTIASSEDIMEFINVTPDSEEVCNFKFDNHVQVLGFFEREIFAQSRAMMRSIWHLIQNVKSCQTVVVLVASRVEVYETAIALKKFMTHSINKHNYIHPRKDNEENMDLETQDTNVSDMLKLGIGILDSGINEHDRNIVHTSLLLHMIRILILNMDVAGPPQLKNHLLIVKGTKVFDDKLGTYVDIPVSKIANKMYICGNNWKRAVILTSYSKSFLLRDHFKDGLLLESLLPEVLSEVINNEIAAGVINSLESTVEYLQRSFLARRLTSNPQFYHMGEDPEKYLRALAYRALLALLAMGCITKEETIKNSDVQVYQPTVLGLVSSEYGINPVTMRLINTKLKPDIKVHELLLLVCSAMEFKKLPFGNEDEHLKERLRNQCRWSVDHLPDSSPLVEKVFILIQYHFSKAEKIHPNFLSYETDCKQVVDIAVKIVQVVMLISCHKEWLRSALNAQRLLQMLATGCWGIGKDPLLTLPHVTRRNWNFLVGNTAKSVNTLHQLQHLYRRPFDYSFCALSTHFVKDQITDIGRAVRRLPKLNVGIQVCSKQECWEIKPKNRHACNTILKLHAGVEYFLAVELDEEENENYYTLIFGSQEKNEVLAMERVQCSTKEILMTFKTPERTGRVSYKLYLLPNDYIGIDQECDVHLNIVRG